MIQNPQPLCLPRDEKPARVVGRAKITAPGREPVDVDLVQYTDGYFAYERVQVE
jgi:hypothetical protein